MDNLTVRFAQPDDATALAGLRWEFRAEDDGEEPVVSHDEFVRQYAAFFLAGLTSGARAHGIAEADGTVVGHLTCLVIPLVPRPCRIDDGCGMITDNYVRPAYRNRGIGGALMRFMLDWARGRDLETIIVWPSDRARAFYARHAFAERTEIMELVLRPVP